MSADHKKLIEAALFISTGPVGLNELAKISGVKSMGLLKEMVEDLQKEYEDRGFDIVKAKEGFHMQVKPEILPKVAHLTPYSDLSEGCKRTLAVIIYKGPAAVTQSEIIKIQGNKGYTYIRQLKKKGLLTAQKKGKTVLLNITAEFERYFGEERDKIKSEMEAKLGRQKGISDYSQKEEKKEEIKEEKKSNEKKQEPEFKDGVKFRKREGIDESGELSF